MKIEKGTTYWGYIGFRVTKRRVVLTETRNSGYEHVLWETVKKDGTTGQRGWARMDKFILWAQGEDTHVPSK